MTNAANSNRDWATSSLGERITHICELRGWSLNKLGDEAGIASGPMSRLSRRTEVVAAAPDTLARIADAAGVSALWLMLGRGPVEVGSRHPHALRAHPDWRTALAEARKRQRGIPEEYWELAGDAVLDVEQVDWQLIVGLVREMYSAKQRAIELDDDEASAPRRSSRR
jgi:transcriptional regulator with XRE-family HTH domain